MSEFVRIRGLRSRSLASRWMTNTLSVVVVVLIFVNFGVYYFAKQYYYGSAESYMISEANATQTILKRVYEDMAANYSSEVREMIEGFSKKDQMELMSVNRSGEVTLSSSGFKPDENYYMPDYEEALESDENIGVYIGAGRGENIIAVTIIIDNPSSSYNALRFVTSLGMIDARISGLVLTCVLISVFIISVIALTGFYFVKSICDSLVQMGNTAKKLAKGDFSERIPITANDEIGQLSLAFNEMADELENSEQIKNDFISSVSHELRTPLTAIKGWSETLSGGLEKPSSGKGTFDEETFNRGMKVITGETARLEQMVEELLDFSRIQSGRLTLQMDKTDIIAELEDALLIYIDKAKKENKTLSYNEPQFMCVVCGDKSRLRQVFINIIDNAVKYTEPEGKIDVTVSKDDDSVIISVKDTGCGIAAEDLPKVKQKFFKANSTKRGSGIGLAVVDEIVSMHGGYLEVNSELGKGTEVTVMFPLYDRRKGEPSDE